MRVTQHHDTLGWEPSISVCLVGTGYKSAVLKERRTLSASARWTEAEIANRRMSNNEEGS